MYLKIGVRSSTFKYHLSLISSHSEQSGQKEWKKFSELSKGRLVHDQNRREIVDDGGALWFEDSKNLPEIDSLQFVL